MYCIQSNKRLVRWFEKKIHDHGTLYKPYKRSPPTVTSGGILFNTQGIYQNK